jgi:Trypsin
MRRVVGVAKIEVRDENRNEHAVVRKWGRKTGITTRPVNVSYAHVQLSGIEGETNEYTVTTASTFSDRGDSGGPVVNMKNRLVGMVLGGKDGLPKVLIGQERLGAVHCTYITHMQMLFQLVYDVAGLRLMSVFVVSLRFCKYRRCGNESFCLD